MEMIVTARISQVHQIPKGVDFHMFLEAFHSAIPLATPSTQLHVFFAGNPSDVTANEDLSALV